MGMADPNITQILLSGGVGAIVVEGIRAITQRKKMGADYAETISKSAVSLLDPLEKRIKELEYELRDCHNELSAARQEIEDLRTERGAEGRSGEVGRIASRKPHTEREAAMPPTEHEDDGPVELVKNPDEQVEEFNPDDLPPEPGTPGQHNEDCLGVDGPADELTDADQQDNADEEEL
jgi:hypothetical protein